ncbi:MAG: dephospho-CoA kinase [Deltaproteobacteria bacterium]|nr:dephospho-CoA kinase [Deltaproteobacteria bacterium]
MINGNPGCKPSTLTLGITGGIASGKSVVCDLLAEKGITVYSADELARKAVGPGTDAYNGIVARFGPDVLCADNSLDRPKLRRMIVSDMAVKDVLEGLIHPEVIRLMTACFEEALKKGETVVGVEVPLLFETGLSHFFDYVAVVTVCHDIRIKRLMERDSVSRRQAEALAAIQMPEDEKIRKSDFVIENKGSRDDLKIAVDRFYHMLMTCFENRDEKA